MFTNHQLGRTALTFLFGDCREHNILLHVLLRIVVAYYKSDHLYQISSVYTVGGPASDSGREFEGSYEHVFPVVWCMATKTVLFADALYHTSSMLESPELENQTGNYVTQRVLSDAMQGTLSTLPAHLKLSTTIA